MKAPLHAGALAEALEPYVGDVNAAADRVDRYFNGKEAESERCFFSGSRFERLWGGGDRPEVANRITEQDIVAVSTLAVDIPAHAALALLDDPGAQVGAWLSELPIDADLWDCDLAWVMNDRGPAIELWRHLRSFDGMGPTRVSKLLARKRPRLLPVSDSFVEPVLGPIELHWQNAHTAMSDAARRKTLRRIRQRANASDISLLRILDVTIWMRDRGDVQWAEAHQG